MVPNDGYLSTAWALLKRHNALLIADDAQTGMIQHRTGMMLAWDYDGVKPDILVPGEGGL